MDIKALPGQEVCDFCSDPNVHWSIVCQAFEIPEFFFGSSDDWAACDTCAELIRNDKWLELTRRSITTMDGVDPRMLPFLKKMHGLFRLRHGEITPYVKNVC